MSDDSKMMRSSLSNARLGLFAAVAAMMPSFPVGSTGAIHRSSQGKPKTKRNPAGSKLARRGAEGRITLNMRGY